MTRLLLLLAVFISSCSRKEDSITSPSGLLIATPEISGEEAGPTRRQCVRLKVKDTQTQQVYTFQTGASDYQKWALTWSPPGTLVLYSSDIGISAYDVKSGQIIERDANSQEQELSRQAYEKKYGEHPRR
jgi:hypothetical protein